VVGVLTRNDLLKALSQRGPNARIEYAMQRQFETADPNEMLETAFARLQACGCHALPLVRNGRLAGVVTMDNVGEFLMVQAALRGERARRETPKIPRFAERIFRRHSAVSAKFGG
jgi:predicted transcriptional regulator